MLKQKGIVLVKHDQELLVYIWYIDKKTVTKTVFICIFPSAQGAIFLFFAGRTEEIKGNIDEVCFRKYLF